MTEKQRRLAAYTRQVLSSAAAGALEAVTKVPGVRNEAAAGALENALNDREFRPGQTAALEAVVHKQFRPALFIKDDSFDTPLNPWAHLAVFRDALKPVIQAIGRVEVENAGIPFGGTGFFVGPALILTNRHVAELFTHGVGGQSRLRFIPGRPARLDTGRELQPAAGVKFRLIKPVMIHPHWDAALFQVELQDKAATVPAILQLSATAPDVTAFGDRDVVVIGYPYWSDYHEPAVMQEVFAGVYGVKRIQPGKLMRYEKTESYRHEVEALLHDSSTLGGNSGSAVIDLETQQVLALHFAGAYLVANYSIPMWELARDPRIVDAGVNFHSMARAPLPRTPEDGGPIWLSGWKGREEGLVAPGEPLPPIPGPMTPTVQPPVQFTLLDPGWFEHYSDEELRRLYQRDPEQLRALVEASFSAEEAQEIYDTLLFEASVEGVLERTADPSLPEIVLMPGVLGSHLRGSFFGRSWLNLLTLPFSNLQRTLGFDPNGNDPNALRSDGYLEISYARAARAWRRQGFTVHEFSYDWRGPLALAARRLDSFLRTRRRARKEALFALVCHGMGGLLASIYARDTADWRDFVEHAVLCGSPLGGCFAIMEILSGEYPFVRKLDSVSLRTNLAELRQMCAGFPGALEMLPHPALFTRAGADVELLYLRESYASFPRPSADWLQASRRIKDDLRSSPLLARTTCLVCVDRPTAGTFVIVDGEARHSEEYVRGDGAVPGASALVPGVPAYRVTYEHSALLRDPAVIDAVPNLLNRKKLVIDPVTLEILKQPLVEAARPSIETLVARWQLEGAEVRERIRHGIATAEDVRWLLSTR